MNDYTFIFKVLDHDSDDSSPTETTIVAAGSYKEAMDKFYEDMVGESVELLHVSGVMSL